MLSVNVLGRSLKTALALTLMTPASFAQSSATEWIYPGQTLPADVGFSPLRAGAEPQAEVKLSARDWFLLKDKGFALYSPDAKALDYKGPVLDEVNAQLYYRLTAGMVLKEAMLQMGMNAAQARRFVEEARLAGRDLDSTPLKNLGPLPQGFEDLNRNWDRPMARMAVLPYLMMPLSIGNEQSQFQHFSSGALGDTSPGPGIKMCSTMKTVAPLAGIQAQIDGIKAKLDTLNYDLRKAQGLAEQSNAELVRLTAKVKDQSLRIERDMSCFSSIKARVTNGSAMPTADCLAIAEAIFTATNMQPQWQKFTTVNLKNAKGDFQTLQEADIKLKAEEAALLTTRQQVQALLDEKAQIEAAKATDEGKLVALSGDKDLQLAGLARLGEEEAKLNAEFQTLQAIANMLAAGDVPGGHSGVEADIKIQIAETPQRTERLLQIKARLPQILEEKSRIQQNLGAINVQVEALGRSIATNSLQLKAIDQRLEGSSASQDPADGRIAAQMGLSEILKQQEKSAAEQNSRYLAASQESNFSEYVLSILTKDLIMDTRDRDNNFELLRKEEVLLADYKKQIEAASTTKDSQWDQLQADLKAQEQVIASYRDPNEMGWFLEADCEGRAKFDSDATGIYLSRAPMVETGIAAIGTRADTGRWGLFNMPYDQFKGSIQNGVLLNLESYIRLSVQKMFENYDFSMTQFMNPAREQCADVISGRTGVGASVLGLLKSAFSIWNSGSDDAAKASGYCAVATAGSPAETYSQSLAQLIQFDDSVLDLTLPKRFQSRPEDLIEREAIEALAYEVALLTGSTPSAQNAPADSEIRREVLIKSMIKVLAFDYAAAAGKSREIDPQKSKYKFASPAPGKSTTVPVTVGSEQMVQSLDGVDLYKAPIARPENQSGLVLAAGDRVRVLAIDAKSPSTAILAGWMKVQALDAAGQPVGEVGYMPSAGLSADALITGAAFDIADDTKCPVRRIVKTLNNLTPSDKVVTRFMPELKSGVFKNNQYQMVRGNTKTSPASTEKVYIACELYSREGQRASPTSKVSYKDESGVDYSKVQGIRIVEAKKITARNGEIRYVPVEDYGGFAHTWLGSRLKNPRITLGEKLDPKSWSIIQ